MSFFDGWSEFKTTPEGKIIFYPNGYLGKGYLIPNTKAKGKIQKSAKRLHIALFTSLCLVVLGEWISIHLFLEALIIGVLFGVLFLGVVIWYQRSLTSLTKELVKSEIKLSVQESFSNLAYFSFFFLLFAEIVSGWMVYKGLKMANDRLSIILFVFGIGVLVFGVLSCITATYIIILKIKRSDSIK